MPDGQTGDLLDYVRREREALVLKPNRSYGGQDVLIGPSLTDAEWDAAVDRALADSERWVVQQLASIPVSLFPVAGPDGLINSEPFHVVMGFAPSQYGVAILGRASQRQVVNIAQRGGMCAVMVGRLRRAGFTGPGVSRRSRRSRRVNAALKVSASRRRRRSDRRRSASLRRTED